MKELESLNSEKQKISGDSSVEDLEDKYMRRRSIWDSGTRKAIVEEVVTYDVNGLSCVGIHVSIGEEELVIHVNMGSNDVSEVSIDDYSFILGDVCNSHKIDSMVGSEIDIEFDNDNPRIQGMNSVSLIGVDKKESFPVSLRENVENVTGISKGDKEFLDFCYTLYEEYSNSESFVNKRVVDRVEYIDENKFRVVVSEIHGELIWDFEMSFVSGERECGDANRIVEDVGGGSIKMIEGSEVYVGHVSQIPSDIPTVSDDNRNYHLITPKDYEEWKESQSSARSRFDVIELFFSPKIFPVLSFVPLYIINRLGVISDLVLLILVMFITFVCSLLIMPLSEMV